MEEIWKKIPGYENYMVSNLGDVLSLNTNKKMSQQTNRYGYLKILLYQNGVAKYKSVHQLVAMAFLNHNPDGTMEFIINHIDYNKKNNNVSNLEIVSCRENVNHAYKARNKKCDVIGVTLNKHGKFLANILYDNNYYYLGQYLDKTIAGEVYDRACKAIENNYFETFYEKIKLDNKKKFTSKYNWVHQNSKTKKWILSVNVNGKTERIGQYNTEYEAYIESLNIKNQIENNIPIITTKQKKQSNKIDKFIYKNKYGFIVDISIGSDRYYIGVFNNLEDSVKYRDEALLHVKSGDINEFMDKIKKRHLQETEYKDLFFNIKLNKWVIKKGNKSNYYNSKKTAIKHL